MLILIIESSSEKGCLALAENEKLLASTLLEGGPHLSKNLAIEVQQLLSNQVPDLVAVGTGPGSYTGIRVGASLAKALAYGWQVPCLGFCSLKAFGPPPIFIDARRGGIYALFDQHPVLLAPEEIPPNIPIRSPHPELIQKRLPSKRDEEKTLLDPSYLASLVWTQFSNEGAPPFSLEYLSSP